MDAEITIKNYRCFPDSNPARLTVQDGFIALIGANNSGKSSLLKFFFEFRNLFAMLSANINDWPTILARSASGSTSGFNIATTVGDIHEIFHKFNDRDISIRFELRQTKTNRPIVYDELTAIVARGTNTFRLQFSKEGLPAPLEGPNTRIENSD